MAKLEQQDHASATTQKSRILKNIAYIAVFTLLALVLVLAVMFGTNQGSKFLLDRALSSQDVVSYEYKGGNLYSGIQLKEVKVNLSNVEVTVTEPELKLGWRAILTKKVHLKETKVELVRVEMKGPSSPDPFSFPKIALPFDLQVDALYAGELDIVTAAGTTVAFNNIQLKDTKWEGTHLEFKDAFTSMGYLSIREADGFIDFSEKYPLALDGVLNISLLHTADIHDIQVKASGSLADIQAKIKAETFNLDVENALPGLIQGELGLQPLTSGVPMQAKLKVQEYILPFLPEQKITIDEGFIQAKGDLDRFNIGLSSVISGNDLPAGKYVASMHTDFSTGLTIKQLKTDLMKGQVNLSGVLDWENEFKWNARGRLDKIHLDHPQLPEFIYDFLPKDLDGRISSSGVYADHLTANVNLDFDRYESWSLQAKQKIEDEREHPMQLQVRWKDINRDMPYVGWLNSPSGQVAFNLQNELKDINLNAHILQHDKGMLPAGDYRGILNYNNDKVSVKNFALIEGQGSVIGQADILLPTEKRPLEWNAKLTAKQFNLAQAVSGAPVVDLNGQLYLKGFSKPQKSQPDQQVIRIHNVDMNGRMAERSERLILKGYGAVTLNFDDEKRGGAFKSFGLDYQGLFDVQNLALQPKKPNLSVNLGGTPEHIRLNTFDYNSQNIGQAKIQGDIHLGDLLKWDLKANLSNIKPQFFYQPVKGQLTGQINTQGTWSNTQRQIEIQTPQKIHGELHGKAVNISGNVALGFDPKQNAWLPKRLLAEQFKVEYADNTAIVNGDRNQFKVSIHAPNLHQLSDFAFLPSDLRGKVLGDVKFALGQSMSISTENLLVQDLSLGDRLKVKSAHIQGEIPEQLSQQNATLNLNIQQLKFGNFAFEKVYGQFKGTQLQHNLALKVRDRERRADFEVLLQGGLSNKKVWSGQLQKAIFKLRDMQLSHQAQRESTFAASDTLRTDGRSTALMYDFNQGLLKVNPHQWRFKAGNGQPSEIKFVEPLVYGANQSLIHAQIDDFDLNLLSGFSPYPVNLKGQLQGNIHLSQLKSGKWKVHQSHLGAEKIDIRLLDETPQTANQAENKSDITLKNMRLNLAESTMDWLNLSLNSQVALNANTQTAGNIQVALKFNPNGIADQSSKIEGLVDINNIPLSMAKLFVADIKNISGTASLNGIISGSLKQPVIPKGELIVKQAQIEMASIPVNLKKVNVYAGINNSSVRLSGTFQSRFSSMPEGYQADGDGVGSLNAFLNWRDPQPKITLRMKGQSLAVDGLPMFRALVTPDVSMIVDLKKQMVELKGEAYIPWARATMPEATADIITVSPDAKLRRSKIVDRAKRWKITTDLGIILAQQRDVKANTHAVIFNAFNNNIPLRGQLRIQGNDSNTRAQGEILLNRNRAEIQASVLGQDMTIKKAQLDFSGPLSNPALDIEVSKKIQGTEVGITVSRNLERPKINFVSDGGLSEQEALNAILTGRIQDGSSSSTQTDRFKNDMNNSLAAAGLSLGLGGTRQFTNEFGKGLGLKGLSLDAQGTADDAQVSITGYLSPELYIRYGIGVFTPVNKLTLRYQASSRLYVEASQSIERALDVFYNWKY